MESLSIGGAAMVRISIKMMIKKTLRRVWGGVPTAMKISKRRLMMMMSILIKRY